MNSPSEYLKIKYAAPTGACKCDNCQLVPHPVLREWVDRYETVSAAAIERAAEAIYKLLPYSEKHPPIKPPWTPGGNSFKQDEARRYACAALTAG